MKTTTKSAKTEQKPVEALTVQFNSELSTASKYVVKTRADFEQGQILLSSVHAAEKAIEAKYESIYRPFKSAIDNLAREFKPLRDKAKLAKSTVANALTAYVRAEEARKQAEIQRTLADKRLKEETRQEKLEIIEQAPALSGTRKQLVLVVTDETKIPREFFTLDETRLKNYLKEGNAVAGAYVEYQDIVVAR